MLRSRWWKWGRRWCSLVLLLLVGVVVVMSVASIEPASQRRAQRSSKLFADADWPARKSPVAAHITLRGASPSDLGAYLRCRIFSQGEKDGFESFIIVTTFAPSSKFKLSGEFHGTTFLGGDR